MIGFRTIEHVHPEGWVVDSGLARQLVLPQELVSEGRMVLVQGRGSGFIPSLGGEDVAQGVELPVHMGMKHPACSI